MATTAAYTHKLHDLDLPVLLTRADLVRATMNTPGWTYVAEAILEHERKMLARLLNETTKPEEFARLRGLIQGLRSMGEAAETILTFAEEREREARPQESTHA